MNTSPTAAEIQRVREHECAIGGHSYEEIEAIGHDGPLAVLCSNCGKCWSVQPETYGF